MTSWFARTLFFLFLPLFAFAEELTFSLIKPHAVEAQQSGSIIRKLQKEKFRIAGLKMIQLSKEQAELFYQEHKGKPFYQDLIAMITSGPVVVMVVEGEQAQARLRQVIGATDPSKAQKGTIRQRYGKNITENAIHASDSSVSAQREIGFFFARDEYFVKGE